MYVYRCSYMGNIDIVIIIPRSKVNVTTSAVEFSTKRQAGTTFDCRDSGLLVYIFYMYVYIYIYYTHSCKL